MVTINLSAGGIGIFSEYAENTGGVFQGVFSDSSINSGAVATAAFSKTSTNNGIIIDAVCFTENSLNNGYASIATFSNSAINTGTISTSALFTNNSLNSSAVNIAAFTDYSINTGTVGVSAFFTGSAVNSGTIVGDAIFADTTTNAGVVQGNAQFAPTATNNGTVSGTITVYYSGNWYDDTSAAAHVVAVNGTVTQSDEGSGVVAALFDGSTGYLVTDTNVPIGTGDFTVELFINQVNDANFGSFVVGMHIGGFQFGHNTADNTLYYSQAYISNILTPTVIIAGAWHHVAAVRSSGTATLYVDGTAVGSISDSTDFGSSPIRVGAYPEVSQWLHGKIAGLRMTDTAVYTGNFTVPTTLPTAVAGTQLLLNFHATAAPTVVIYTSWAGTYQDCSYTITHGNLYTDSPTLAIGVKVYTLSGGIYTQTMSTYQLVIGDNRYNYAGGEIVSIDTCSGY